MLVYQRVCDFHAVPRDPAGNNLLEGPRIAASGAVALAEDFGRSLWGWNHQDALNALGDESGPSCKLKLKKSWIFHGSFGWSCQCRDIMGYLVPWQCHDSAYSAMTMHTVPWQCHCLRPICSSLQSATERWLSLIVNDKCISGQNWTVWNMFPAWIMSKPQKKNRKPIDKYSV